MAVILIVACFFSQQHLANAWETLRIPSSLIKPDILKENQSIYHNIGPYLSKTSQQIYHVSIDSEKYKSNLSHFWVSTGFCPPDPHQADCQWFLSQDMQHNLALIGAVPNGGIQQVRIHWLLDSVTVSQIEGGKPKYNFTCLDMVIQQLWQNGLRPGFEIMGNPSNFFTDFENKTQVYLWRDLVKEVASRYIDLYGLKYVSTWNFEAWNEPDGHDFDTVHFTVQDMFGGGYVSTWNFESWNEPTRHSFHGLNMTIKGFLNYYDACFEGLKEASPLLHLGAPGGECHDYDPESYCWATLLHISNGRNYFTGKKDITLDFISIHKKGEEPQNTRAILDKEKDFISQLQQHIPSLASTPVFNDEGDPLVGWSQDKWWRADATYAAMVTKIIHYHQKEWKSRPDSPINLQLLSNDNGFLSNMPYEFSQRSLLARFQINNTSPPHVQMVRKPVYSVMGLLSLLGEQEVHASVTATTLGSAASKSAGVLAAVHLPTSPSQQDSWQLGAVVYLSEDSHNITLSCNLSVQSSLPASLNTSDVRYMVYILDNDHGSPYKLWRQAGSPPAPSWQLLRNMRLHEEPVRVAGPAMYDGHTVLPAVSLSLPGVLALHMCARPALPPDQVTGLTVYNITVDQVLLVWSDHCVRSKCLKTYEVELSRQRASGPYTRINPADTFFTSYSFMPQPLPLPPGQTLTGGYYRVRAVDYWDRAGQYSLVVKYSPTHT